ncbi:hypothetical protein MNEG_5475 [Monoraphidium neglectum]|jgi:hypothetical protein|uniref:Uncharacterized protein n=1 Tax=Monoraphidium neglectum TaxID=145388 RepID=A0A0D2MHC7_9CHLO|nr:hypothetical protein MNEG_5475 [Monoraphidium neglectum]KIZ02480.1 hypothetical protein MNEG_5475 [Monoraphidium neglectum]|eukprot:XP_013901499.1 hypothetical protein MNEG_5475 [Monoraphidium neglectum]
MRAALLQFGNLMVLGPERGAPLSGAILTPLDAESPPLPAQQQQQQQPQPPPAAHWRWAIESLGLDPRQRALAATLLSMWRARMAALTRAREALAARCAALAADAAAHEAALSDLGCVQASYILNITVFLLALYGTILTAQQHARLSAAAWPWAPSLQSICIGFQELGWLERTPVAAPAAGAGAAVPAPTPAR